MNFYPQIKAVVVADSIGPRKDRITSMLLTFPRIVLAEFNTHRMFTRNSASSRAIPFKKMVELVKTDPFIPVRWMKEHTGMQGTEFFRPDETFMSSNPMDRFADGLTPEEAGNVHRVIIDRLKAEWLWARDMAVQAATNLNNRGVHYHPDGDTSKLTGEGRGLSKQLCNRLLEPFMWHTVLVTATEWENFFALRAHPDAEIHIQELAHKMLDAYNESTPRQLAAGEWHIPLAPKFITYKNEDGTTVNIEPNLAFPDQVPLVVKIATANCARTSYMRYSESEDSRTDIKLHDRLAAAGHWSPFEHCAMAMGDTNENLYEDWGRIVKSGNGHVVEYGWCGNFRGFIQYRKLFDNENRTDARVRHIS